MLNNIAGILAPQVPAPTNSYESIQTYTVGAGGQATIDFTTIPSTYKHLQIRGIALTTTGGRLITVKLNNDATSGNYTTHLISGEGTTAKANAFATSQTYGRLFGLDVGTSTTYPTALTLDLLDYANTSKNKTLRTLSGSDTNGGGEVELSSNLWLSTAAVSSITLGLNASTFAQYSSFALYGIKA